MKGTNLVERWYERSLTRRLVHIPNHIAIIQDGNRRFARSQGIDTSAGHRAGADTTERMLDWVCELGIPHLSIYSFSTENFNRPKKEVEELFALFQEMLRRVPADERVHRHGLRVRVLGDRALLPHELRKCIEEAEESTAHYRNYHLNIALAYGGRNEILNAVRSILSEVRRGALEVGKIDIPVVERFLNHGLNLPPVDLIVRTGNERRISNFLPWLANGNESAVYFCAPYWPLFRKIDLLRAIRVYDQRMRHLSRPKAALAELEVTERS
jgi:tritrans,polycis-undecaprenyl-diphosphate synthase [geranylgeranyl-diphosphate specific]